MDVADETIDTPVIREFFHQENRVKSKKPCCSSTIIDMSHIKKEEEKFPFVKKSTTIEAQNEQIKTEKPQGIVSIAIRDEINKYNAVINGKLFLLYVPIIQFSYYFNYITQC